MLVLVCFGGWFFHLSQAHFRSKRNPKPNDKTTLAILTFNMWYYYFLIFH